MHGYATLTWCWLFHPVELSGRPSMCHLISERRGAPALHVKNTLLWSGASITVGVILMEGRSVLYNYYRIEDRESIMISYGHKYVFSWRYARSEYSTLCIIIMTTGTMCEVSCVACTWLCVCVGGGGGGSTGGLVVGTPVINSEIWAPAVQVFFSSITPPPSSPSKL